MVPSLCLLGLLLSAVSVAAEGFVCAGTDAARPAARPAGLTAAVPAPASGTRAALIVFAGFPGDGTVLPDWAAGLLDPTRAGSIAHFYDDQSFGRLRIRGEVALRRYVVGRAATDYAALDGQTLGQVGAFVTDVLAQVDADVDLARFDNDGPDGVPDSGDDDGVLDMLLLVTPQLPPNFLLGQATGLASLGLLEAYESHDPGADGGPLRVGAEHGTVQVGRTFAETAGTIAHEIGHLLGLPDLYDTRWIRQGRGDPAQDSGGIGHWGLMGLGATGWHGTDGPAALCGWSRKRLGWNGVQVLDAPEQEIVLDAAAAGGELYEIALGPSESYLLELRRRDASYYERNIPGEGLLIWHYEPARARPLDLVCADGLWAEAGYPTGRSAAATGGDNLDFWAHDADYAAAHAGNLGDATDPFDGERFTAFVPAGNPSSRTARGLTPRVESIVRDGARLRARVRLDPPRLTVADVILYDESDDGVLEAGESGVVRYRLENTGGQTARDVHLRFEADPGLAVDPDSFAHPDVFLDPRLTSTREVRYPRLRLDEDALGTGRLRLGLRLFAGGVEVGRQEIEVLAASPVQRVLGVGLVDAAGNGDGVAQAGEIVRLVPRLRGEPEPLLPLRFALRGLNDEVRSLGTGTFGLRAETDSTLVAVQAPEFLLAASLAPGRRLRFELRVDGTFASWRDTLAVVVAPGGDRTPPRVSLLRVQSSLQDLHLFLADRWIVEGGQVVTARATVYDSVGAVAATVPLRHDADGWSGLWADGAPGVYRVQATAVDEAGNEGRGVLVPTALLRPGEGSGGDGQAGWASVSLPGGSAWGRYSGVAVAPSDARVWYVSTNAALYRSDDAGDTWRRTGLMHDDLFNSVSLTVDRHDPNTVYVVEFNDQLLVSHDGGGSWRRASLTPDLGTAFLTVDPHVSGRVFARVVGGMLVSEDEGTTWRRLGSESYGGRASSDAVDADVIYLGQQVRLGGDLETPAHDSLRLWRSTDGGDSWRELPPMTYGREVVPDPAARLSLYGITRRAALHSTDGGETWDSLAVHVSGTSWQLVPTAGGVTYLGAATTLHSADGGATWREVLLPEPVRRFAPGAGGRFLASSYSRLYRGATDSGETAQVLPLYDAVVPVAALAFGADGSGVASSVASPLSALTAPDERAPGLASGPPVEPEQGVFYTHDGGASWAWRPAGRAQGFGGVFDALFVDPLVPDVVLAHRSFGTNAFQRSTDAGQTWDVSPLDIDGRGMASGGSVLVRPTVLAHPVREGEYLVGEFTVQRTRDFGATWKHVGPRPRSFVVTVGFNTVGGLAFDPRNAARVTASLGDSLYRSDDDGETWRSYGRVRRHEGIFSLAYHPADPGCMYAVTVGGLYLSTDDGATWERRVTPASGRWISARLRQHPLDADRVYLVTGRELWESRDAGQSWSGLHEGFEGLPWFNDVAVSPGDGEQLLVATTWGLYRLRSGPVTAVTEAAVTPQVFRLEASYPNPFNGTTTIRFHLPRAGSYRLEVYDVLGQRVRTLLRGEALAGPHRATWDGRTDRGEAAASGVYLVRLSGAGRVLTSKMLHLE